MEIYKNNFEEKLPGIIKDLNEASFVAIDGEFTGVVSHGFMANSMDTPEERYHKLRQGTQKYLLCQFGLCVFTYHEDKHRFTVTPYRFYVFPRRKYKGSGEVVFTCQSSSIDFLCEHGFDFNKVFKKGIDYLRRGKEAELREELEDRYRSLRSAGDGNTRPSVPITAEHKPTLDKICENVQKFLDESKEQTFHLEDTNAFIRRLTYQVLKERFGDRIHTGKAENHITVTRSTPESKEKMLTSRKAADTVELEKTVGFSKVIRAISESGVMVVGHNLFLDVMFSVNQFCCELPEDYQEYKEMVNLTFKKIVDTKLMMSTEPIREHSVTNTSLEEVYATTQKSPFERPLLGFADGFPKMEGVKLHDAAYDAYITGVSFISLTNYLGTCANPPRKTFNSSKDLVAPFVNKLFMSKNFDINHYDMDVSEAIPDRSHVFHVTFPLEWTTGDVIKLFKECSGVSVHWVNKSSAFVSLWERDHQKYVMSTIPKSSLYQVTPYGEWKRSLRTTGGVQTKAKDCEGSTTNSTADKKRAKKDSSALMEATTEGGVTKKSRVESAQIFEEPSW